MNEKETEQNGNRTIDTVDPPETEKNKICNLHPEEVDNGEDAIDSHQSEKDYPVDAVKDGEVIEKSAEKDKGEINGDTETILKSIADLRTLIDKKVEKGDKLRAINEKLYDDLKKIS